MSAADRDNVDLLPYSRAVSFGRKIVTKTRDNNLYKHINHCMKLNIDVITNSF